jgi:hypothetical protein
MKKQARERTRSGTCCAGITLVARLLAIGIYAACGVHPPAETHDGVRSTSQPASLEDKPLDLTVRVRAERDGQRWGIASGDTLETGDFFELFVYLNHPAYLYVIQVLPDGTSTTLFPGWGDRMLTAGREHRIPGSADESFQVVSNDLEENIYILMSRVPLVRASALLPAPVHPALTAAGKRRDLTSQDPPKHDQKVTNLGSATPTRPDRVLSITTRRVIRVKRPDGTPTVVDTTEQREDSTLIVRLHFRHA